MSTRSVLAVIAFALPAAASAMSLGVGHSSRRGSITAFVQAGPVLVQYIDEGRQPYGIPNVNRLLDVDATAGFNLLPSVRISVSAGVTDSSLLSKNGSGGAYKNTKLFGGYNAGVSARYQLARRWSIGAQCVVARYPQSSTAGDETFEYADAFLSYGF